MEMQVVRKKGMNGACLSKREDVVIYIHITVVNLSACSASAVWVCFPNIVRRYDVLGAYSALHRGGLACGFALDNQPRWKSSGEMAADKNVLRAI
jgi:hypothetical protein